MTEGDTSYVSEGLIDEFLARIERLNNPEPGVPPLDPLERVATVRRLQLTAREMLKRRGNEKEMLKAENEIKAFFANLRVRTQVLVLDHTDFPPAVVEQARSRAAEAFGTPLVEPDVQGYLSRIEGPQGGLLCAFGTLSMEIGEVDTNLANVQRIKEFQLLKRLPR